MLSVLILFRKRKEGMRFGDLCSYSTALLGDESLKSCIMSYEEFWKEEMRHSMQPDLLIVGLDRQADIEHLRKLRRRFPAAACLLVAAPTLSPECYVSPAIHPDLLLLRPYDAQKAEAAIRTLLEYYFHRREAELGGLFPVRLAREERYYRYRDIYYFEAHDKKLLLYSRGEPQAFCGSLQQLSGTLPEYFVRCHRSYIVNFLHVEKVDWEAGAIYLREQSVIPLSKRYRSFLQSIFDKTGSVCEMRHTV